MAILMALGTVSMVLVNTVDTFWVARLGTDYVAAMTYTFPVVGLIINLALGVMDWDIDCSRSRHWQWSR